MPFKKRKKQLQLHRTMPSFPHEKKETNYDQKKEDPIGTKEGRKISTDQEQDKQQAPHPLSLTLTA